MPLSSASIYKSCLPLATALLTSLVYSQPLAAQQPPSQTSLSPSITEIPVATEPATKSPASGATIKIKTNLILVPVVIRDSAGHAVGNLKREDFQVFDNRKPEEISQFTVEQPPTEGEAASSTTGAGATKKITIPTRFTAILFDDIHSTFENLPQVQSAALRLVANLTYRPERMAIFTTSGRVSVDFTDDGAKLADGIRQLKPHPLPGSQHVDCPDINHYDANQIVNRNDQAAFEAAVAQVMSACGVKDDKTARAMVHSAAESVLRSGDVQTETVLSTMSSTLDRLAVFPGQRTITLASPSFLISDRNHTEHQIVDRAVRLHVVINTLDTRGLYADSDEGIDSNVLFEFANGTGGLFFHNSNDINEGLKRLTAPPEFVYQLGFSPQDLPEDGKYHHLKVKLVNQKNFAVYAREGYFAPLHIVDPRQAENNEINEALFSHDQVDDLPIQMQTQFVQEDKPVAKVNVVTFVDLRNLPHRQADGRNANELRIVAAVFDHNCKYLGAIDKRFAVHWSDEKLTAQNSRPPATMFTFILDSGAYLIRLVARDSESQHLSTQNALIEIPQPSLAAAHH
jgi:VWFA-related protein